jgi:hypothetical protein
MSRSFLGNAAMESHSFQCPVKPLAPRFSWRSIATPMAEIPMVQRSRWRRFIATRSRCIASMVVLKKERSVQQLPLEIDHMHCMVSTLVYYSLAIDVACSCGLTRST